MQSDMRDKGQMGHEAMKMNVILECDCQQIKVAVEIQKQYKTRDKT